MESTIDLKTLHAKIGELTLVNNFLSGAREGGTIAEHKAMIDRSHALPLGWQARELEISRGRIYYLPKPVSANDLAIMRRIDELHMEFPFAGGRMLRDLLRQEGIAIGRQPVERLHIRRLSGVATPLRHLVNTPFSTDKLVEGPAPGHKNYPYLLRR